MIKQEATYATIEKSCCVCMLGKVLGQEFPVKPIYSFAGVVMDE